MVARKPGHQGEREVSRKAIAQGRPACFRFTWMLVCAFPVHQGTRDRGCSAHPVFPAPSGLRGSERNCKARAKTMSRECGRVSCRHCERSEAIQSHKEELDCFVASAPRNDDVDERCPSSPLPLWEREEAAPRWLFRELTRPEAAAGNECCVRRREPPRLRASVPSCCAGPRTNHRASWSATPRTALS